MIDRLTERRDGIEGSYPPRIDAIGGSGVRSVVGHPSAAAQTTQELKHDGVCRNEPCQKSDSPILVSSKSLPFAFRQPMELAIPRDPACRSVQELVWVVFVAFCRVCRVCNADRRPESVCGRRFRGFGVQAVTRARSTTTRAFRCAATSEASILAEGEMSRSRSSVPIIVDNSTLNRQLILRSHLGKDPISSRSQTTTRTLRSLFDIPQPSLSLTTPQHPQLNPRPPLQRSRPPPRPILPPLPLNNNPELLLKSPFPNVNHKPGDKDRRAHHNQQKQQNLLKSIDSAKIDGPQPGERHGADDQEEGVDEPHAVGRRARSPEDDRGDQAGHHKVGVVDRDEIERGQPAADEAPRADERPWERSHWMVVVVVV